MAGSWDVWDVTVEFTLPRLDDERIREGVKGLRNLFTQSSGARVLHGGALLVLGLRVVADKQGDAQDRARVVMTAVLAEVKLDGARERTIRANRLVPWSRGDEPDQ